MKRPAINKSWISIRYAFGGFMIISLLLTSSFSMEKKNEPRNSIVTHPEWSRNAVIYEVNIRQYTPEGTFRAFSQHLDRLRGMGVDILWLMPVHPIGLVNRKGTLGSYYSIRDYMAVNPEYGTMDDFRELVKKAHDLGMKVIIDWVANHTSWDNALITEHPEWYTRDLSGKVIAPVEDWTDVADLDYSRPELRDYMTRAMIFWVKEAGIDGFRCDVAGMVPVEFWNKAVPEIQKVKPVFMLAEWDTPEMHDTAFDMTYGWDLFKTFNAIAKGEKSPARIDSVLKTEARQFHSDAYRMRFTSNHDENSWNGTEYERLGDGSKVFAVLSFTLPGMPLIYSGQEAAYNKRLDFFDKDTIQWGSFVLEDFYTRLIALKKGNRALFNGIAGGEPVRVPTNRPKEVYAFTREKGGNSVFVITNLSSGALDAEIQGGGATGSYREYFTGEEIRFASGTRISLKGWDYRVYIRK